MDQDPVILYTTEKNILDILQDLRTQRQLGLNVLFPGRKLLNFQVGQNETAADCDLHDDSQACICKQDK